MNVKEINNYYAEAREKWGNTSEYKEYEAKSKNRTKQEFEDINDRFMNIKQMEMRKLSSPLNFICVCCGYNQPTLQPGLTSP